MAYEKLDRTLRPAKDYGIKIAKKGYDARTAASNQLLYNSSFPMLQIVDIVDDDSAWTVISQGQVQQWSRYTGNTVNRWIYQAKLRHGLCFPPMLLPIGAFNTGLDQPARYYAQNLKWDDEYVYADFTFYTQTEYNNFINSGNKVNKYIICAVDISTDIEYQYFDSALETTWGEVYDYGLKHLLTDDVNTTDPQKLGLNANVQSQLAIAVKIATVDNVNKCFYVPAGLTINDLTVYPYVQDYDGYWTIGTPSYQDASGYRIATVGGETGYALDGQYYGQKCSLVAVRQPMISSDVTRYNFHMG